MHSLDEVTLLIKTSKTESNNLSKLKFNTLKKEKDYYLHGLWNVSEMTVDCLLCCLVAGVFFKQAEGRQALEYEEPIQNVQKQQILNAKHIK